MQFIGDEGEDWKKLLQAIDDAPEIPPCTNDPELFFPDKHGPGTDWKMIADACASCPIVAQCADYGIKWAEHGIWGGLSAYERRQIRAVRGIPIRGF